MTCSFHIKAEFFINKPTNILQYYKKITNKHMKSIIAPIAVTSPIKCKINNEFLFAQSKQHKSTLT